MNKHIKSVRLVALVILVGANLAQAEARERVSERHSPTRERAVSDIEKNGPRVENGKMVNETPARQATDAERLAEKVRDYPAGVTVKDGALVLQYKWSY